MTPIIPEENEDKQDFDKKVKNTKIKRNRIRDTRVARKKDNEKVRQSRLSDPRKKANPFKPAEPRRPQSLRGQSVPQPRSPRSLSESEVGELGQPQDSKAVRSDSRSKAERIDSIQLGDLGPGTLTALQVLQSSNSPMVIEKNSQEIDATFKRRKRSIDHA
jgi:hypothetical protein